MTSVASVSAKSNRALLAALSAAALVASPGAATARHIPLDPPGQHEFIRDLAGLITEQDQATIRATCEALLRERATPVIVVTIDSMEQYGGAGMEIETFARLLFDQWGVGRAEFHGRPWNTGILFLVSKYDRKARIQLGAGWPASADAECRQVLDRQVIPFFKMSDYSGGIVSGVEGLDWMARGLPMPTQPMPRWAYPVLGSLAGLVFMSLVSVALKGRGGWGWLAWSILLGALGYLLWQAFNNMSRGGGSGGSFDGGFSDGGGASGSW